MRPSPLTRPLTASPHAFAFALSTLLSTALPPSAVAQANDARWFPDRPVAWAEHDDVDLPRAPAPTHLQDIQTTLMLRDSVAGEVDRVLALHPKHPAQDVNALDEVPCSTWFCARNHLRPMSPDEVASGPTALAPQLPLRITKGKDDGASAGFQVVDAAGRKFMLKFDPTGHLGLSTAAEMLGERIFHAAGYYVPGAFRLDLRREELQLDPRATYHLYKVEKRPVTLERVEKILSGVARLPDGRLRAVATPWVAGQVLGGFDMIGRREDDPNDRIPHEHRRSLRATWLLFSWICELDPGSINTLDTYIAASGRHFVRHFIIDFGATLGSFTTRPKGIHEGSEHVVEVGRTLESIGSLGFYRRPFQDNRAEFEESVTQYPSLGWFPAETFDPEAYRPRIKVPAHMYRTARDLYWGAKVVTSFTDEQLSAMVAMAGMPARDSAALEHALRVRRDIIGRRYMRAVTAVENPTVLADDAHNPTAVCFDDLAIARGFATPFEVRYASEVTNGRGTRLSTTATLATDSRTCVPLGPVTPAAQETGYRIVQVTTRLATAAGQPAIAVSKPARIHLRWRPSEQRFAVVGLERDE